MASGDTVVVPAVVPVGPSASWVPYVFVRPPGGWSDEIPAASLRASDGSALRTSLAISGHTIAVTGANGQVYVFVRPSGGWSGVVEESAKLAMPVTDVHRDGLAISGPTIFASVPRTIGSQVGGSVLAFNEPAGGWSGTVQPSAELITNSGAAAMRPAPEGTLAASGPDVFVAANPIAQPSDRQAFVFHRPPGGWSGTIHEIAALMVDRHRHPEYPLSLAANGPTVAVDSGRSGPDEHTETVSIFSRPKHGWTRSVRATGNLSFQAALGDVVGESVAVSRHLVAAFTAGESSQAPAFGFGYARRGPAQGWFSYSLSASRPSVAAPGYVGGQMIALDDRDMFVVHAPVPQVCLGCAFTGGIDVHATSAVGTQPSATSATLRGATRGLRLALRLFAGANSPAIHSFSLRLPSGMSFASDRHELARGLSIAEAGRYSFHRAGGALVVRLDRPAAHVSVTLAPPAVSASTRLLGQMRHRRVLNLAIRANVIDSSGSATGFLVRLTVR